MFERVSSSSESSSSGACDGWRGTAIAAELGNEAKLFEAGAEVEATAFDAAKAAETGELVACDCAEDEAKAVVQC